jgi:hypothetical protein
MLLNGSPMPSVCGDVVLSVEKTVKWSYRALVDDTYRILRTAHAVVKCAP